MQICITQIILIHQSKKAAFLVWKAVREGHRSSSADCLSYLLENTRCQYFVNLTDIHTFTLFLFTYCHKRVQASPSHVLLVRCRARVKAGRSQWRSRRGWWSPPWSPSRWSSTSAATPPRVTMRWVRALKYKLRPHTKTNGGFRRECSARLWTMRDSPNLKKISPPPLAVLCRRAPPCDGRTFVLAVYFTPALYAAQPRVSQPTWLWCRILLRVLAAVGQTPTD